MLTLSLWPHPRDPAIPVRRANNNRLRFRQELVTERPANTLSMQICQQTNPTVHYFPLGLPPLIFLSSKFRTLPNTIPPYPRPHTVLPGLVRHRRPSLICWRHLLRTKTGDTDPRASRWRGTGTGLTSHTSCNHLPWRRRELDSIHVLTQPSPILRLAQK